MSPAPFSSYTPSHSLIYHPSHPSSSQPHNHCCSPHQPPICPHPTPQPIPTRHPIPRITRIHTQSLAVHTPSHSPTRHLSRPSPTQPGSHPYSPLNPSICPHPNYQYTPTRHSNPRVARIHIHSLAVHTLSHSLSHHPSHPSSPQPCNHYCNPLRP